MKRVFASAVVALVACLSAQSALAVDRIVPGTYATIADAITAASSGDRVVVNTAGSYAGFTINAKDLEVANTSAGTVTITGTINIDGSPTVILTALTVTAPGNNGVSVNNSGSTVSIVNSVITGNNQGVRINDSNTVTLNGTSVNANGTGLVRDGGASAGTINITNGSTLNSNTGRGIELYRTVNITISDSQVNSNSTDGIFVDNDPITLLQLTGAQIRLNGDNGIELNRGTNLQVTAGSQIQNNSGAGIQRINGSGQATTIAVTGSDVSTNNNNIDVVENATVTITDTTVNNGGNYGLWLRDRGVGAVTLTRSDFRNNSGGNLRIENTSGAGATTLLVSRSRFERSGGGVTNIYLQNGALAAGSSFANSIIHEGSPQFFSMNNDGSTANIRFDYCTVVSRFGTTGDGIRLVADGSSTVIGSVYNSIVEGADRALNFEGSGTVTTVSNYNVIRGALNGVAVAGANDKVGQNPLFVTPTTGSLNTAVLSLQSGSPAVDAANASLSPGIAVDYSGTARPIGATADMGAYEYGDISVDVDASQSTITVDGNAADWSALSSGTIALNTGGRGALLVNVKFAWDANRLYILAQEVAGDATATEGTAQASYGSAPYNFDTVALFLDLNNSNDGEQNAQDFSPWFGLSSTGRTDLFSYRANNDTTYVAASLPSSIVRTSGTIGSRVIEAGLNWSDLALVVNSGRQPGSNLVAAIADGFKFGCEPLLVDDNYNKQSFLGGAQYTAPTGLDANSRNIVLRAPASSVTDWMVE